MWILFLILNINTPATQVAIIHEYVTLQECHTEKTRIDAEMRQSYPGDETFRFGCIKRPA